ISRATRLVSEWKRLCNRASSGSMNKIDKSEAKAEALANITLHIENLYSWCIVCHICWNCLVQYKNALVDNKWDGIYHLRRMAVSTNIPWLTEGQLNALASSITNS